MYDLKFWDNINVLIARKYCFFKIFLFLMVMTHQYDEYDMIFSDYMNDK